MRISEDSHRVKKNITILYNFLSELKIAVYYNMLQVRLTFKHIYDKTNVFIIHDNNILIFIVTIFINA